VLFEFLFHRIKNGMLAVGVRSVGYVLYPSLVLVKSYIEVEAEVLLES